jgi:hypothetical protein
MYLILPPPQAATPPQLPAAGAATLAMVRPVERSPLLSSFSYPHNAPTLFPPPPSEGGGAVFSQKIYTVDSSTKTGLLDTAQAFQADRKSRHTCTDSVDSALEFVCKCYRFRPLQI